MVKLIIGAGALAGWACIIALAYRMAGDRIALCPTDDYGHTTECAVRAAATQANILTLGLTFGLIAVVIAALAWTGSIRFTIPTHRPAKPAGPTRLR